MTDAAKEYRAKSTRAAGKLSEVVGWPVGQMQIARVGGQTWHHLKILMMPTVMAR